MANTTNFNWETPDDTDLVKDGAAAMRTLGNSIDTSMSELKGGTTGQVLSKTSNTDMDFTWVAQDDSNAIQNAIVDAKGDLIAASANDTPARLAVGNNGETLVADSSTSTGLRYTAGNPIPNPVINSNFSVWQRGTSFTPNATTYTADRWQMYVGQTGTTVTRQATSDTTNLAFIQYCMRVARDSGNTGTNVRYLSTPMETVNSIPYAGKTVTFSFYARKGANFSGSLLGRLYTGTGTDQNPLVTYTGYVSVISETLTLTTTWQRFTYTATLGTTATEMTVGFDWTPTGTAGAADYFEVTGVQVDIGSVALPYRPTGATFQGELSAAQRYYYRANWDAKAAYPVFAQGGGYSTTSARLTMPFPVNMRVQPTAIESSALANLRVQSFSDGTSIAPSSISLDGNFTTTTMGFINAGVASGLTANALYYLRGEGSTAYYIGWSAEL
jgi:hypothetical protein